MCPDSFYDSDVSHTSSIAKHYEIVKTYYA